MVLGVKTSTIFGSKRNWMAGVFLCEYVISTEVLLVGYLVFLLSYGEVNNESNISPFIYVTYFGARTSLCSQEYKVVAALVVDRQLKKQ